MLSRVYTPSFFFFATLPVLASGTAIARGNSPGNQCNVGTISCCNQVGSASSFGLDGILGLLGILLDPQNSHVGVNCSPINVIGAGGNSCSAQPVCCTGNQFNGLINVGCSPININL